MKFRKGQKVLYSTISGKSYSATVVERKTDFNHNVLLRSRSFYYVIKLDVKDIKEDIFCMETNLTAKNQKIDFVNHKPLSLTVVAQTELEKIYSESATTPITLSKKVKGK